MTLHVESAGSGPDLVLLHGWGMHGGLFAPLAERLAARFRVHVVDLPGHGRSPALADVTLRSWAAAVYEAVPACAAWLGWSLGGMVALENAHARPGSVTRLVTVACTPRFVTGDGWPHAVDQAELERFAGELQQDPRRAVEDFLSLQCHGAVRARSLLRALRPLLFVHGEPHVGGLAAGLDILRDSDLRARAAALRTPLLSITGGRDRLVPPSAGEALAEAVPGARNVTFMRSAHAPFLSEPDRFADLTGGFLSDGR